ncbi:MAG: hypothetical protein APF80_02730 [Alphaproteobacteria bacterium BRH_c36]|nr:MAG: hypothetical protein APF80_02730 [Alphaproteobacteria bacterium BRH_c36]
MKFNAQSGAAIAAAVAALVVAGAATAPAAFAGDKGHCVGANACKGHSACKTATNACNGQNACKGTGFTVTTAEECAKIEGAKFEPSEAKK